MRIPVWLLAVGGVILSFGLACRPSTPPKPALIPDDTAVENIHWEEVSGFPSVIYENGEEDRQFAILESLGGGVGVIDYDRDGREDLCFPGGGRFQSGRIEGRPSVLVRGIDGQWGEISAKAGLGKSTHYSHGCAVGDYNNDGFSDLLITGYGGVTLWFNQGDGTFSDETDLAGLTDRSWSSSAAWADLNGDGQLDLYLAHYVNWSLENNPPCVTTGGHRDVCPPRQFEGLDDTLYLSQGDGTFSDASRQAGLVQGGKGLGALAFDADGDADTDLYVANDTTSNFLYINDGHGHLVEAGLISGTAFDDQANANGSMGVAVTDFNRDGLADIWVTNYEDEVFAIYQGQGEGNFVHSSTATGVRSLGTLLVGFGCVSGDWDLDGDEDFVSANGHVIHRPRNAPVKQLPLVLMNDDGRSFQRIVQTRGYLAQAWSGRGVVTFDDNQDGSLDLAFANVGAPAAVVHGVNYAEGRGLRFRLIGRGSNRDAIGSRVELLMDRGAPLVRWVYGGGSYLSTSSPIVHVGVPKGSVPLGVRVTWSDGAITTWHRKEIENQLEDHELQYLVRPPAASSLSAGD